jgi:hypothetical protein
MKTRSNSLLCAGDNLLNGENRIHAAGAISLGIEGDVEKAEWTQCRRDAVESFKRKSAWQFLARDLDAGEIAVMANANLPEAKIMESFLGLFNLGEIFWGNGTAVLDARCKTGRSRFVPELESRFVGELADLRFGELSGDKGSDRMMLAGSLLARPELAAVVEIHSIGKMLEPPRDTLGLHAGE